MCFVSSSGVKTKWMVKKYLFKEHHSLNEWRERSRGEIVLNDWQMHDGWRVTPLNGDYVE